MRFKRCIWLGSLLALLLAFPMMSQTEAVKAIQLPKPQTDGGKPLMQVLKERKSTRAFSDRKLSEQTLSDLLWAACGINRPDGRRTAPTAMNKQEIDVYVILAQGAFLYDPKEQTLKPVVGGDLREQAGTQPFAKEAPVNLIYVADTAKMGGGPEEDKILYYGADTGFVSQNVYLYCASEGLATVVRASFDRAEVARALKLGPGRMPALAQTVGYPKE